MKKYRTTYEYFMNILKESLFPRSISLRKLPCFILSGLQDKGSPQKRTYAVNSEKYFYIVSGILSF